MDGFGIPLSPERREGLDKFESILDMIRRLIESIPKPGSKSQSIFSGLRFRRESAQLKAELDRVYNGFLEKHYPRSSASRHESILEIASLSTQAAGIALDLPVLNVLKPLVGMAALICDRAKTVNTNRTAAIALAVRAQEVTTYIVDRATELHADRQPDGEGAVMKLRHTLRDIQAFLKTLQNHRKRSASWLFAVSDKERFAKYNYALDEALSVFSTSEVIETAGLVLLR